MNVLIVTMGLDIGGAETHVYNLALGLKRRGIEPIIISSGGVYVELLKKENIQHIEAPVDIKDFKSLLKSLNSVKKAIKEKDIHIVHAHGRIPSLICKISAKKYNKPFIVTAHAKFKYNLMYRYTSFWGQRTICISEDIKSYLVNQFKVNAQNITIIENGIDTDLFNKEESVEDERFRIVFVSRLDDKLGPLCKKLIDAVALLDNTDKTIELNIVGDGPYYKNLEAHIQNKQLINNTVNLLGKKTDVYNILPKNQIAVCVSRSAMEAMACKLPIIIAGGEGYMGILTKDNVTEAMSNNLTGRGYESNVSVETLKEDISRLITMNVDEIIKMGEFNREIILNNYSLTNMVDKTINIYKKMFNQG
ncbi:glycosyltransferase involved in cell wall biosynthesis [Natranaerovirga hydrolytica]|uniref:Glycosyltransferase involved in cell wall biosynthesis n=1 Tax=Natranaerovirga hydrolytica TaxID=680378 RepID=A0A4R1MNE2_9FIRM|nr:glycosyltransferase family 4 protein [Natranaerovirga hydrolytica]TCK93462.1 glycosyltransferase involved in cell wall biosynthesis [Natranaerovirga hydrolytica]